MTDFLFSSTRRPDGVLSQHFRSIFRSQTVNVVEYHGTWGSLAATASPYRGFDPIETLDAVFIVLGAPVLRFTSNAFLRGDNPSAGTVAVHDRWRSSTVSFENDLDGPFLLLDIDKVSGTIRCVTDLMMFIPAYSCLDKGELVVGSHVDVVAIASGAITDLDEISVIDFILNDSVTYPWTIYNRVRQLAPAAVNSFVRDDSAIVRKVEPVPYWAPVDNNNYRNLSEAAVDLAGSMIDYVDTLTEPMTRVAQFLSGGEDSRAIAGLLPPRLERHGYCYVDHPNREERIARRIADAYGMEFHPVYRTSGHYIEYFEDMLVQSGSCNQGVHCHSVGIVDRTELTEYDGVFGGQLSDTLLKGVFSRRVHRIRALRLGSETVLPGESKTLRPNTGIFPSGYIDALVDRRREHLKRIQFYRPDSDDEWFSFWPMTMYRDVAFYWSNRRLMPIYEPFMNSNVVRIAAAVPIAWKLNHEFFRKSMKHFLEMSRWIPHSSGGFPILPWRTNQFVRIAPLVIRRLSRMVGMQSHNQGSWPDWATLCDSPQWQQLVRTHGRDVSSLHTMIATDGRTRIDAHPELSSKQQRNAVQLSLHLYRTLHSTERR